MFTQALRQSMKWRQEIKHASRFKVLASVIIQKHWRGYKARLTIRNLRSDVEKLRRENEQKNRMLAEGDAAQKVLAFLQHMQSVYESGRSVMQVEVSGRLSRSARSVSNRKTTADILRRIRLGELSSIY